MSAALQTHQKWILTKEAFDALLCLLSENRDQAAEKYLEIRRNLVRFFEWRGCQFPEDHADETVNRVAKKVWEGEEIQNPKAYFIGVARLLLLEIHKSRAKESHSLNELALVKVETEPSSDVEGRADCLQKCLQGLSADDRELILQYYQGEKSDKIANRRKIAERLNLPINSVRMRALRLREKLQTCMEKCAQ